MTALSKIFNEELDRSHYITDRRYLFLGSSMLSLATWTVTLVKYSGKQKRVEKLDEVSSAYIDKTRKDRLKSVPISTSIAQLTLILKQVLSTKDVCYAVGIAAALILRTMCDLWMIQNSTQIEAAIISADLRKLKLNILEFLYATPILAFVNNGLKFCIQRLQLNLRYKISSYLTDHYTRGLTYYHINALDNKFKNIDQLLTNDVDKFCQTLVDVYSNIAKPLLDIIIYVQKLSYTYTGMSTPSAMIGYLLIAGGILTSIRRPLTRMTVKESQLEGELRFVHSRLITNCEEVAFYQGNDRENLTLSNAMLRLRDHLSHMLLFKFSIDYVDNVVARYLATVCGYLALSMPFLTGRYANDNQTARLETYYKSGRIMMNMSQSIGRLVSAGRDLNRLSAYTQRVNELITYFGQESTLEKSLKTIETGTGKQYIPFSGQAQYCDNAYPIIQMIDVPLCTPAGDVLVHSINFKVVIGQNVIITGPNGSGKSSLFRLLGGLWPLYGGTMIRPTNDKLFYIPQKPYMALGTFRDQIIYPDTYDDMLGKGITDEDLLEILHIVKLEYLLERESFDSVQDWQEVLSGGEKQRVALSRLLYHKPQFAILDECTSAVSADVEQSIYQYLCEEKFCSLLSVSHRVKQLHKYHDYVLEFDGNGSCSFRLLIEDEV